MEVWGHTLEPSKKGSWAALLQLGGPTRWGLAEGRNVLMVDTANVVEEDNTASHLTAAVCIEINMWGPAVLTVKGGKE